jgi:hypothetical protein
MLYVDIWKTLYMLLYICYSKYIYILNMESICTFISTSYIHIWYFIYICVYYKWYVYTHIHNIQTCKDTMLSGNENEKIAITMTSQKSIEHVTWSETNKKIYTVKGKYNSISAA